MITDHVVTLQPNVASKAMALGTDALAKYPALKAQPVAELPPTRVVLALRAEAPSGRFRLRLWNDYGRKPTDPNTRPENRKPMQFAGTMARTDIVLVPPDGFDGSTLTWVVRLQASGPAQYYSVRLTLLQVHEGTQMPSGDFAYSGPLDDVEEITGRFHFKVGA